MEDAFLGYRFILLVLIIGMNAFFASAEMSLVSARPSRLRELAAAGNVGAQSALNLLTRPERLLATVQVGVTLAGLGAGWAGEDTLYGVLLLWFGPLLTPAGTALLHAVAFVIAFLVLTYVMVVFGEVTPKNLGIKRAEGYAVVVAPLLLVFYRISQPFIYLLERSSAAVSGVLGLGAEAGRAGHSVEELKLIAGSVRAAGNMAPFVETSLDRLLDIENVSVREIMVPRNDIAAVPLEASLDHVLRAFIETQYTRLPVYEGRREHIVGYLHYKDLLPLWQRRRAAERLNTALPPFRMSGVMRRPLVVPESKPLTQMIDEFRRAHAHIATVVDEFGTIVGLVTMEDVLEQIFGEIEDEHDVHRPLLLRMDVLELEGSTSIRDLESQYGIELPTNAGFETLAGFLLFRLGYIPKTEDSVIHEGRRFTITEMQGNRIARVKVEKLQHGSGAQQ
jgi:putative hemolysin